MALKSIVCFVFMMALLLLAFLTNDDVDSKLFASIGIITGALASKGLSMQNQMKS